MSDERTADDGKQEPGTKKAGMSVARELVSWLRFAWATLTSMRTALILLLVLGIAAIPGSLLPQRPTSPIGVSDYFAANPGRGARGWTGSASSTSSARCGSQRSTCCCSSR